MLTWQQQFDDNLCVRAVTVADAEAMYSVIDAERARLREWLPWPDQIRSVENERAFLQQVEGWHRTGRAMVCVILVAARPVGTIGLNTIDLSTGEGQIGYWLARGHQGRGLMTRCVRGLTDWTFDALRLVKLDIRVAVENLRSRAVAERLGYEQTQVALRAEQLADRVVDHAVYVMTRKRWDERSAQRRA